VFDRQNPHTITRSHSFSHSHKSAMNAFAVLLILGLQVLIKEFGA